MKVYELIELLDKLEPNEKKLPVRFAGLSRDNEHYISREIGSTEIVGKPNIEESKAFWLVQQPE